MGRPWNITWALAGLFAMSGNGPLVLNRPPVGPVPLRETLASKWRSTYDPNRFRDDGQRLAAAAMKRARRLKRNRRMLAAGAVHGVSS